MVALRRAAVCAHRLPVVCAAPESLHLTSSRYPLKVPEPVFAASLSFVYSLSNSSVDIPAGSRGVRRVRRWRVRRATARAVRAALVRAVRVQRRWICAAAAAAVEGCGCNRVASLGRELAGARAARARGAGACGTLRVGACALARARVVPEMLPLLWKQSCSRELWLATSGRDPSASGASLGTCGRAARFGNARAACTTTDCALRGRSSWQMGREVLKQVGRELLTGER